MKPTEPIPTEYEFSIIIPVLHEQRFINSCLEKVKQQPTSFSWEVIVVDGDPQGETIKTVHGNSVIKIISPKGRAKQMNAGANAAKGRILLFLHADTQLPPNALQKIQDVLADEKYVAGAFDLDIDTKNLFIKFIAARARLRSRITRVPYGDQAIFIRKEYFENIGGFRDIPLMEDVALMKLIKKRGDKIFILRDRVMTSARRWEKEGPFYTTLRNMVVMNLYRFGISPEKLLRFYKNNSGKGH